MVSIYAIISKSNVKGNMELQRKRADDGESDIDGWQAGTYSRL